MNELDLLNQISQLSGGGAAAAVATLHIHIWWQARKTRDEVRELERRVERLEAGHTGDVEAHRALSVPR